MLQFDHRFVGVDVVGDSVRALAVRRSAAGVIVEDFLCTDQVMDMCAIAAQLQSWRGKLVVGLVHTAVVRKALTVDMSLRPKEVMQYLRLNLERLAGVRPEAVNFDFCRGHSDGEQQELQLVATKAERIVAVREVWPTVAVVDVASLALVRAVGFCGFSSSQLALVVEIQGGVVNLCLLLVGNLLHAEQEVLPIVNAKEMVVLLARKLQMFVAAGFGVVEHILFFKGDGVDEIIAACSAHDLPAVIGVDIAEKVSIAPSLDNDKFNVFKPRLATALGLALWDAHD
ncbi:MAG: hypothetical protein KAS93_00115 [Gammaproteobacteria bacterium]|nr:hypothetical protein [Gammaproteobacteria bacterium]